MSLSVHSIFFCNQTSNCSRVFVKKIFLPLSHCLCSFCKDPLTVCGGVYFWALHSVLLIYMSSFTNTLLSSYSSFYFVLKLDIKQFSNMFFFSTVLAILAILPFTINFRIRLSISTKQLARILILIVFILQSVWEELTS